MLKITVKILTVLTVISLSGCVAPAVVSMITGAASVAVNETTGRTTTDHVVSVVNGKDCRVSRMGCEDVCQDTVPESRVVTTRTKPSSVTELEARYR